MGLDGKQHRKINRLLQELHRVESFEWLTIDVARKYGNQYLYRKLQLSGNRTLVLTDQGLSKLNQIDHILQCSNQFLCAQPQDISSCLWKVLSELLSDQKQPEDSHELIELIVKHLKLQQHRYWYVVPVHGLVLDEIDSVQLGEFKLIKPTLEAVTALGVDMTDAPDFLSQLGNSPCIAGSVFGTESYAKREFRYRAELTTGILATVAAIIYDSGTVPFRITLGMSPEGTYSRARYLHWHEEKPDASRVHTWGNHHRLPINSDFAKYLQEDPYVTYALTLAWRNELTPVEDAIVRGLFWYSDAQRDSVGVMQLVKFWSCAEAIFSEDGHEITKSVSTGVACILTFGPLEFVPKLNYETIVKELTGMYKKRSIAVHNARHDHITGQDITKLSQWTAQMIISVIALILQNKYHNPIEIKRECQRIAKIKSHEPNQTSSAANAPGDR